MMGTQLNSLTLYKATTVIAMITMSMLLKH